MPGETGQVEPWTLSIPEQQLDDLRDRLEQTRWPDPETVAGTSQGAQLQKVQALCDHWRTGYDWRRCERMLNGFGQYRTVIDGLDIHFLHIRSRQDGALPVILTHGWPGSVIEFHKVIGPLTNPSAFGDDAADAFDLVIPSLPGFGFSGKPTTAGWDVRRIARAWATLMERLGYSRWAAQGGDWGASVTNQIAMLKPPGCVAIHVNTLFDSPKPGDEADPSPLVQRTIAKSKAWKTESAYAALQSTRPQTLGYSLADTPAGQAAWIYEKFQAWTDNPGEVEQVLTRDEMLDDIMLYWLPNAGASAARLYWESLDKLDAETDLPAGVSLFLNDIHVAPRSWAGRTHRNVVYWNELAHGGHFAAFEQPGTFVDELRRFFRMVR